MFQNSYMEGPYGAPQGLGCPYDPGLWKWDLIWKYETQLAQESSKVTTVDSNLVG